MSDDLLDVGVAVVYRANAVLGLLRDLRIVGPGEFGDRPEGGPLVVCRVLLAQVRLGGAGYAAATVKLFEMCFGLINRRLFR